MPPPPDGNSSICTMKVVDHILKYYESDYTNGPQHLYYVEYKFSSVWNCGPVFYETATQATQSYNGTVVDTSVTEECKRANNTCAGGATSDYGFEIPGDGYYLARGYAIAARPNGEQWASAENPNPSKCAIVTRYTTNDTLYCNVGTPALYAPYWR
jgi:hypothetical protein